jgi:hypothetical protein
MVWLVPLYVAAWLVPASRRAEWRERWIANLCHWRVLADRGELPAWSGVAFLRRGFADACHERFGAVRYHRMLRGPAFLIVVQAAALLAVGFASHGFAATRHVLALISDMRLNPHHDYRYDIRGDRIFEYLTPVVVAAAIGVALVFVKKRSLRSLGWRLWTFMGVNVVSLHLISSLLWIEGGRAIRSHLVRPDLRIGVAGFGLGVAFMIGYGFLVLWSIADQRRRCPVCLHRLMMPVALGSWASIFDPAQTEFVCEEGHGSLALVEAEAEVSAADRWTELDSSWQYLFPKDPQ